MSDDVNTSKDDNHWHLDKKVPLGIIFVIAVQTITFTALAASWRSDIEGRMKVVERSTEDLKQIDNRTVKLEEKFSYLVEGLSETKQLLRESVAEIKQLLREGRKVEGNK